MFNSCAWILIRYWIISDTDISISKYISQLFSAIGYWLGGYNFNSDSDLEWISQPNERMPYPNFTPGEPNQPTSEKCLMAITNYNFEWVDAPCQMTVAYICEFWDIYTECIWKRLINKTEKINLFSHRLCVTDWFCSNLFFYI